MKGKNKIKNLWNYRCDYLFVLPYFIIFFIFTVLPVLMAIGMSFTYYNMLEMPTFVGFRNYIKMFFGDQIFPKVAVNTLVFALTTGPLGYIISLLVAWMINDLHPKIRTILVFLIYAPTISGNTFLIWKLIFSDDAHGLLNGFLTYFGFTSDPIYFLSDPKYMMIIVIIVSLWMSMGTGFLSFVAGLQGVDISLLEAGMIDGVRNRWQEFWLIIIPSMRPQLMFGAVMSITGAFTVGTIPLELCGSPSTDYAVQTIVNHMSDYGNTRFEMGYASAIATFLFIITVLTNKLVQRMLKNIGS